MGARGWGARTSSSYEVKLNVYDLSESNDYLHAAGLGFYHSGLEVGGNEYTFASGSGIFHHDPQDAPGARFRCTVTMGILEGSTKAINDAVYRLREEFGPDDYNVLSRNCNHFSDALCRALIDQPTPPWVNRMANVGSYFSCLFPPQMLGDAPVNEGGGNYANNGSGRSGYIMTAPGRVNPPAPTAFAGQGFSLGGGGSMDPSQRNKENMRKARLAAVHAASGNGKAD